MTRERYKQLVLQAGKDSVKKNYVMTQCICDWCRATQEEREQVKRILEGGPLMEAVLDAVSQPEEESTV